MAWQIVRRALSTKSNPGRKSYIDEWHAATVKPASFYEELAAPGLRQKKYFYSVDLQGRVFLEETLPKNIATSIKNIQFLDFFFRRMRRLKPAENEILQSLDVDGDYPFFSPCGPELNFVRPADSVIVFHTLLQSGDNDEQVPSQLGFGGSLIQPFYPEKIVISKKTGRLYHELCSSCQSGVNEEQREDDMDASSGGSGTKSRKSKQLTPLHDLEIPEFGLIRSSVAVALSENIVFCSDRCSTPSCSDMDFVSSSEQYPIPWLPGHAEPGPWSMPVVEDDECIE